MNEYCGFIEVYSSKHIGTSNGLLLPFRYLERVLLSTNNIKNLYTVAVFKIKLSNNDKVFTTTRT